MKYTILIVDDNKLCRQLFLDILSENYITIEARNGQEAIDIINKSAPDLIVTDINMPVMNGLQLLKKLALNPQTDRIPVLVVSSVSEEDKAQHGLKLGALDYITKPFNILSLDHKIRNILKLITLQHGISKQKGITESIAHVILTPKQLFNKKLSSVILNTLEKTK